MSKTKVTNLGEAEEKLRAFYQKEVDTIEARDRSTFPRQPHEKHKYVTMVEFHKLLKLAIEALENRIIVAPIVAQIEAGTFHCGNSDCEGCNNAQTERPKCH